MNFKDYLSSAQAAQFLGVSKQTLNLWEKKGKLTAPLRHPITGWRIYRRDELQAILDEVTTVVRKRLPIDELKAFVKPMATDGNRLSIERMIVALEDIQKDIDNQKVEADV